MAANGISTLSTKEQRQLAKLNLAANNKIQDGYTKNKFDINLLPTTYVGNNVVKNNNANRLANSRPWHS